MSNAPAPGPVIHDDGYWTIDGVRHREDGPAYTTDTGNTHWYYQGRRHREGGPAVEIPRAGIRAWYVHGKLHRTDGPAIIGPGSDGWWHIDGHQLTKDDGRLLTSLDPHIREAALRLYKPGTDVTELVETVTSALTEATA